MKNTQVCQTILNSWLSDYQRLHDLLNSEQIALEKRDFDQLAQLVKEKDQLVAQINGYQIPPLLDANGIQVTSMGEFQQFCQVNSSLNSCWRELMQLVEKCHLKNEVNARLIELLNASAKRTFNLIKGVDPDNNIYNASGNRASVHQYGHSLSA